MQNVTSTNVKTTEAHSANETDALKMNTQLAAAATRIASLEGSATVSSANSRNHHLTDQNASVHVPSTIIGNYELEKTVGKGNFSTVKLARHKVTSHSVAVKIVKFSTLSEDNLLKIKREIEILKKIRKHDHIVRLYQVIKSKRYFFLVTEYCANGELYDYLVSKGRLGEPQACKYFMQIVSAVEFLHNHDVVHRDLKAENLLLTNNFETVKIADFGFANYFKRDHMLSTWCGSPPYAAPELFKGVPYVGPPVDLWSMGVILYVLVCGSLPFDASNLVHLKSRVLSGRFRIHFLVSTDCESLIRKMLCVDPVKRYTIPQIKSHCWIQKHTKEKPIETCSMKFNSQIIKPCESVNMASGTLSPYPETDQSDKSQSSSNRGQSLDLDEDKKPGGQDSTNRDASMLCLTNSGSESAKPQSKLSVQRASNAKVNPSNMRNLVDTEIANAVSNMSIDSNNSSVSVSLSLDATNPPSHLSGGHSSFPNSGHSSKAARTDGVESVSRHMTKEVSVDDQIIDFMVSDLEIAKDQSVIRQSINDERYDDLHGIYLLLKDQPDLIFEPRFKIPTLPLVSEKIEAHKRPSITSGFFNLESFRCGNVMLDTSGPSSPMDQSEDESKRRKHSISQSYVVAKIEQPTAMDLVTGALISDIKAPANQQRFEEQTWAAPPQLFLTPPVDSRAVSNLISSAQPTQRTDFNIHDQSHDNRQTASRHSFDSTVSQYEQEKLPASLNTHEWPSWDNQIIDSQGILIQTTTPMTQGQGYSYSAQSGQLNCSQEHSGQSTQTFATITTNLPQIGATNLIDQGLLLAHFATQATNAVMTQSGVLSQPLPHNSNFQTTVPIELTPNNLINQNYSKLNQFVPQSTTRAPVGQNLLQPDGLLSSMERRASDGQASYSSLTTNQPPSTYVRDPSQLATSADPQLIAAQANLHSMPSNQKSELIQRNHRGLPNVFRIQDPSFHQSHQFDCNQIVVSNSLLENQVDRTAHRAPLSTANHSHDAQFSESKPLDLSNKMSNGF